MLSKRELKSILLKYGSTNIEGNRFYVRIRGKRMDREKVLHKIHDDLVKQMDAVLKFDNYRLSRIGYIQLGIYRICVKPHPSEKVYYSGKFNETFLYEKLTTKLQQSDTINVVFFKDNKKIIYRNVYACEIVTKREKFKKSDIRLYTKKKIINLSIKQDDGERYESGDTRFGNRARILIDDLKKSGKIQVTKIPNRPVYKLSKEVFFPMDKKEAQDVVYGEDADALIIQTFSRANFSETNKTLIVECHGLYERGEIPRSADRPVWLIRNDSSRNSKTIGIPGIRAEAVFSRRIIEAAK